MTRRRKLGARTAVVVAAIGLGPLGLATLEDRGAVAAGQAGAPPAARKAGAASALPAGHPPIGSSAALPPGHPPTGALPPGHPATEPDDDEADEGEALPPGHPATGGQRAAAGAEQQLPEDTSDIDKDLATGTIVIEVLDPTNHAVPRADVSLGILQQSVAKGESRRHVARQADESGTVRFDGLESGSGVAYRVTVPWASRGGGEGATYAAPPFQLDLHHGQRVQIHVFPVTNRISEAMLGMDGIVYMELRDDVIQFDELFRIYNLGAITWVPSDVVIKLPSGSKGFTAQKEMSDAGWDDAPGGAKLRGTFGPGQHETHFRYQIPYSGDESVDFTTSLPPHVARMRVMAEASKGMTLQVADFPSAISDRNQTGQRILLTERQIRAGESPPSQLRVTLDNIPTEGSAKWVTTGLATATVLLGIVLALEQTKSKPKGQKQLADEDAERARSRLVTEIAQLDKARAAGDVGPKAYDRIRSVLIDALARLMATPETSGRG
jgi:hypothetical protein